MGTSTGEVTLLLRAVNSGDLTAQEKLFPLVYKELHRLAEIYMRRERRPEHTLQPTALINEAYLRLVGKGADWKNREHFIGVAAKVMRQVLVDFARKHNSPKRGGDLQRVELEEGTAFSNERSDEVLAVDEALEAFKNVHPRRAHVVELHYFAGLSDDQIAALLKISVRTVQRDWLLARDWLSERIR
jgi:RNA polymerase sigma factor (TIGR02999 family)